MKTVQILIESPLLKEYLRNKLEDNSLEVIISATPMEAIAKMRSYAPDLIILDLSIGRQSLIELLKKKKADINTVKTPVVILAEVIEQRQLIEMASYNVKNVFTKPIKIDMLFASLSKILNMKFKLDSSQSNVEVTVNENIIFIEIANGFNRDKIDILRYKIEELFFIYRIRIPRIIIMLSDIRLNDINGIYLHSLLHVVLSTSRVAHHYIKILTKEDDIRQFFTGQKEYAKIEVVSNLNSAINSLLKGEGSDQEKELMAEQIGNELLKAKTSKDTEEMSLKFEAEKRASNIIQTNDSMKGMRIALIDDDFIIQSLVKNTFANTGAQVDVFSDGEEFLAIIDTWNYDLVLLDINMPIVGGFDVLAAARTRNLKYPIIILSSDSTRDSMIKAIQMGVISYLVKPIRPEDLLNKSVEILKANF